MARQQASLPPMATRPHFQRLVERVRLLPPLPAAFVYPCDRDSIQLALSGAFAGYLAPVLVGPETRIRDLADRSGLDISRLPIVDTADTPMAATERAILLVRDGKVTALVKGSMSDGDLLAPVAAVESGLRTDRRLSHAYFVDLPARPNGMLLADAMLNVTPNLAAKRDIVANTIELARTLGVDVPAVALLAAMEQRSVAFPSTTDAAALKSMAEQGAFGRARVDGPLTPDSALSAEAARVNGVQSEIAGRPDVLFAPSMEGASLVLRTLLGLTHGLAAGIVLGAKVPIVIPGQTESMEVRMASCVLASLIANATTGATAGKHAPARIPTGSDTAARAAA
jgi:phosphate acetyltransferase